MDDPFSVSFLDLSSLSSRLREWARVGAIADIDRHLAEFVARHQEGGGGVESVLSACILSWMGARGHTCLCIEELAGHVFPFEGPIGDRLRLPDQETWCRALSQNTAVAVVENCATGMSSAPRPMILAENARLYWHRLWVYEEEVATRLRCLVNSSPPYHLPSAQKCLLTLFPHAKEQRLAAALALRSRLTMITGGPGTGKTQTVARILIALQRTRIHREGVRPALRSLLAAPTGKAAARLRASLSKTLDTLEVSAEDRDAFPREVLTVHRLLNISSRGASASSPRILDADAVIIDEASMVDLAMMRRVLAALSLNTRLILLGDAHQLASVEAGQVWADLCPVDTTGYSPAVARALNAVAGTSLATDQKPNSPLADVTVNLTKNYRFGEGSGIGELAKRVNRGDVQGTFAVLRRRWRDLAWHTKIDTEDFEAQLYAGFRTYIEALKAEEDPQRWLNALDNYRILCAYRHGPWGTVRLNQILNRGFCQALSHSTSSPWYPGRPVMIVENDYEQRLFNGDVGIYWQEEGRRGTVYFSSEEGEIRGIPPERLPPHESALAITVHKAQGSEFETIAFVLAEQRSLILTRELFYTAITRARNFIHLFASESILKTTLESKLRRHSGLRERLEKGPERD